ncbi:hypothetical protein JYB64_12880 [Algoriphagus aestuarii]|nr:hypothetical protein [Algoriphagus aestuarii]
MKNLLFLCVLLIVSHTGKTQNLKILENRPVRIMVLMSDLEKIGTKLGFDEDGVTAEIKQLLRSNGFEITNDPFTNISLVFTVEGLILDGGLISYSSKVTVSVAEGYGLIKKNVLLQEITENDEFYLEYFYVYQKGYSGVAGSSKYMAIKETLISLTRQFVEDYFKEIE